MLPGDEEGGAVQTLPVDLAANARSLGAHVIECASYADFAAALQAAQRTSSARRVIYIQNDRCTACPATRAGGTCRWPRSATCPRWTPRAESGKRMRARERYFF